MKDLTNDIIVQKNKNGVEYIQFRKLLDLGIKHAYALKSSKLNIASKGANPEARQESYTQLCNALELDVKNLVRAHQGHTDKVQTIDKMFTEEQLQYTDGIITNEKDLVLATINADCILYLLYDPQKRVIGNIHSGWRGSYQRIMEKTIDKMVSDFQSNPEDIIICICPSIRKCCFEVDIDVRDMFNEKFSFISEIDNFIIKSSKENKYYIDTVGINNVLLQAKGIKKENIIDSNICSVCNSDVVHSYRVEKENFKLSTAIISL